MDLEMKMVIDHPSIAADELAQVMGMGATLLAPGGTTTCMGCTCTSCCCSAAVGSES